jgi:hypothetical protein
MPSFRWFVVIVVKLTSKKMTLDPNQNHEDHRQDLHFSRSLHPEHQATSGGQSRQHRQTA